ncbi:MAG: CopG family transcriptional regulator [Waterburya sp.]
MPKVGKLVPPEKMALADANGIPRSTLYNRINNGWDVDRAISEPPKKKAVTLERNEEGIFVGAGKGKTRHFSLPEELDEKLDKAIAKSGLAPSQWIEEAITNKLKKIKV